MSILTVTKVQKIYRNNIREIHALEDITFSVEENEFATLVGPSGISRAS